MSVYWTKFSWRLIRGTSKGFAGICTSTLFGGRDMSFMSEFLEKSPNLSAASKYTTMNGYIYLGLGALFILWPGAVQTLFMDDAFTGHEKALFRVIGMTVAVIGWLYLFGGRSGGRQIVAASILDRWVLVPAVGVPVALAGVFPRAVLAFVVLDASLALGAWMIRRRAAQ
jgi:hypothetical protein